MHVYAGFQGTTLKDAAEKAGNAFFDLMQEEHLLDEASFRRWEAALLQFLAARGVGMCEGCVTLPWIWVCLRIWLEPSPFMQDFCVAAQDLIDGARGPAGTRGRVPLDRECFDLLRIAMWD